MCDLFEKLRVTTLVGVQPQRSVGGTVNYDNNQEKSGLLFPVRLFEVAFCCIGLYFEEIVIFSGRLDMSILEMPDTERTYVSLTMMGGNG